ncbi:Ribonuclease H domain [Macleaya cordata]|uniref:Ribonuclease H domain n=1 Tax=Macleaya cordata TaxID=56857 RepID=A0A200R847_MACCD|nr:Ribonuclease H domain [Macleaya cordata]
MEVRSLFLKSINNIHSGDGFPTAVLCHSISNHIFKDLCNTSRSWNRGKLQLHFDQSSIDRIVQIPLSTATTCDRRAWDLSGDGCFTTKSAYDAMRGMHPHNIDDLCKAFWKEKLPHRVELFILKCAKNAIPVKEILRKRMNLGDNLCPKCHLKPETIMHTLVTCPHLRFWLGLGPPTNNRDLNEHFPLVACTMWAIWRGRNDLIYNNKLQPPQLTIKTAISMIPPHRHLPNATSVLRSLTQPQTPNWSPPRSGRMKINTDGAWDNNLNLGGLGIVARDSAGLFHYAAALSINVCSAEEAEVRAIWIAVKKARDWKITSLEVESDALFVV